MVSLGKRLAILALAAIPGLGCAAFHRPYENDPVLRERNPVWGDIDRARARDSALHREPEPPRAAKLVSPLPEGWSFPDDITSPESE